MAKKNQRKKQAKQTVDIAVAGSSVAEQKGIEVEQTLLIGKPATHFRPLKQMMDPIALVERNWKEEIWPMLLVFLVTFLLYTLTAPRGVALEDDGLFLMNLELWGVSHPPGYPLYSLFGSTIYNLFPDFITAALRGHLVSGFFGSIACVALYAIIAQLIRGRLVPLIGAIAYGFSELFWSQAIIAEVYSLNAMMYFIVMALCLNYSSHRGDVSRGHLVLYCMIAFVYGLGLSNHWPLLGLGSIGLLMMVISQWSSLLRRLPIGGVFLVLGLLPYTYLIVRSQMENVPLNFYGPIDSFESLFFYVARSGYSGVDNQEGVGLTEKIAFINYLSNQYFWQFTPLGIGIAAAGFVAMLRSKAHCWLACGLFVAWFMSGPMLIGLIDFKAEFIWFSAFRVYHLLSYGITAIWFAYGLAWIIDKLPSWLPKLKPIFVTPLGAVIGSVVLVGSLMSAWEQNDRSDYNWGRDLAVFKLTSVEQNAHLFTFDDLDLPVGFVAYVDKIRPDITVYNDQGLVFGNRLYSPFVTDQRKAGIIASQLIQGDNRPVYYHPHRTDLFKNDLAGSDFLGFWRRVNKDGPEDRVVLSDTLLYWIENALDTAPQISDRWTRQQIYGVVSTLISAVSQGIQHGYQANDRWQKIIQRAYDENDLAHLVLAWTDLSTGKFSEQRVRDEIIWVNDSINAEQHDDQILDKRNFSDMLMLVSQAAYLFPEAIDGELEPFMEDNLLTALELNVKPETVAFLISIYRAQGRFGDGIDLIKKYYKEASKAPENIRRLHLQLAREVEAGTAKGPVINLPTRTDSPQ